MDLEQKVKEEMRLMAEIKKLPLIVQSNLYKTVMHKWNGNYQDFSYWPLMIQEYKLYKELIK